MILSSKYDDNCLPRSDYWGIGDAYVFYNWIRHEYSFRLKQTHSLQETCLKFHPLECFETAKLTSIHENWFIKSWKAKKMRVICVMKRQDTRHIDSNVANWLRKTHWTLFFDDIILHMNSNSSSETKLNSRFYFICFGWLCSNEKKVPFNAREQMFAQSLEKARAIFMEIKTPRTSFFHNIIFINQSNPEAIGVRVQLFIGQHPADSGT